MMGNPRRIPVAAPVLAGNEGKYLQECVDTNWITTGAFVKRFERSFAEFCDVSYARAIVNGTAALHVALAALDIGPGDEVIVPSLTYIATANAVMYCGATPVFCDCEPDTWNMNPNGLPDLLTPRTKAIVVVHLYGHPADMDPILEFAEAHKLKVVEDAAEAHGALYKGRKVGSMGHMGTFSFYGNKIITSGEGGMITSEDKDLIEKCTLIRGQGMSFTKRYFFPIVGYNYRMTNLSAAVGLAQMEQIETFIGRKRTIAEKYQNRLRKVPGLILPCEKEWAKNVYWIFTVLLEDRFPLSRDEMMTRLAERGIETRPVFYPVHTMPPYAPLPTAPMPVTDDVAARGINLPSGCGLQDEEIDFVCDELEAAARES